MKLLGLDRGRRIDVIVGKEIRCVDHLIASREPSGVRVIGKPHDGCCSLVRMPCPSVRADGLGGIAVECAQCIGHRELRLDEKGENAVLAVFEFDEFRNPVDLGGETLHGSEIRNARRRLSARSRH